MKMNSRLNSSGSKLIEFLFIVVLLLLAIFILTPRHWEPGVESWHKWAAARILQETGEFPAYAMGPLSVTYLIPFSLLKYPLSITVEYWITHLFSYMAIYLLLQNFMRRRYAVLLTIAWIPHLAIVEPGGVLVGIGLVCLYFIPTKSTWRNEGYLPPTLLAATLTHSVYLLFLVGHIIGTYIERRCFALSTSPHPQKKSSKNIAVIGLQLTLLLLPLLMIITPVSRPDHNHILMDPTYAPILFKNPLEMAFFQLGTERYVRRTFPEAEWVYHDWYLSTPQAYDGATTIAQAFLRKPETVFRNLITNLGTGLQVPGFLVSGAFLGPISLLFFIFPIFGFLSLFRRLKEQRNYSTFISIIFGTSSAIVVLALTTFNHSRYVVTLLPIGFMVLVHTAGGFSTFAQYWINKIAVTALPGNPTKNKIKIMLSGTIFIILGLIANGRIINKIILPYKELPLSILRQIMIMDLFFIVLGVSFILFSKNISAYLQRKKELIQSHPDQITAVLKTMAVNGTSYLIIVSVVLLLLTVQYPSGTVNQIKAVFNGEAFLSGQEPISMVDVYPQLQKHLPENSKVLAREYTWVMAFTDVKLDNIYQIWSIPPVADPSGKTEEKLRSMDLILVSSLLQSDRPNIGTQTYPRYIFHIKPFLEKTRREGWTEEKIAGYGTIYRKDKSRESHNIYK